MVERFNGRISEFLQQTRFDSLSISPPRGAFQRIGPRDTRLGRAIGVAAAQFLDLILRELLNDSNSVDVHLSVTGSVTMRRVDPADAILFIFCYFLTFEKIEIPVIAIPKSTPTRIARFSLSSIAAILKSTQGVPGKIYSINDFCSPLAQREKIPHQSW